MPASLNITVTRASGHLFGLPFSTSVMATEGPYIHGGSIEANASMLWDSWDRAVAFLDKHAE